jgi:hypothetical protein
MKYELKGLKTFRGIEGNGYNVSVYRNGEKAFMVIEDGSGGCCHFEGDRKEIEEFKKYAKEKDPSGYEQADLEMARMVDLELENRKFNIWCKNSTVFRLVGDEEGKWRMLGVKYGVSAKMWIETKYKGKVEEIVNERFQEAVNV